jgi:hypothetical protein
MVGVDLDGAIAALAHARGLEAQAADVGNTPGREQHRVGLQAAAVVQVHLDAVRRAGERRDVGAQPQVDAAGLQLAGDEGAHFVVEAAQHLLAPVQEMHLGAEAAEDGSELAGDVAAAHHRQPPRERVEVEHRIRADAQLRVRHRRHRGRAARRDEDVARGEGLGPMRRLQVDGVAIDQAGPTAQDAHAGIDQQLLVDAVQARDLGRAVGAQAVPVEARFTHLPAVAGGVVQVVSVVRRIAVQLLGDAADVHAGAAQPLLRRWPRGRRAAPPCGRRARRRCRRR